MAVEPPRPEWEDPSCKADVCQCAYARQRSSGGARDVNRCQKKNECPECDRADAIARLHSVAIDENADCEYRRLDADRSDRRIPQSQSHFRPTAWEKGKIGAVHDDVEQPVADHTESDHQRSSTVPSHSPVHDGEENAPRDAHDQAMRPWVVVEIERAEPRCAPLNPDVLDTQEQQDRP